MIQYIYEIFVKENKIMLNLEQKENVASKVMQPKSTKKLKVITIISLLLCFLFCITFGLQAIFRDKVDIGFVQIEQSREERIFSETESLIDDIDFIDLTLKYQDAFVANDKGFVDLQIDTNIARSSSIKEHKALLLLAEVLSIINEFWQDGMIVDFNVEQSKEMRGTKDWGYISNSFLVGLASAIVPTIWFAFVAGTIAAAVFSTAMATALAVLTVVIIPAILASGFLTTVAAYVIFYIGYFIASMIDALIKGKGVLCWSDTMIFGIPKNLNFTVK